MLPHLTCNACSQVLLLGRLLVPLVDHHLPAIIINNVQLIHRQAPTRPSSSWTFSASATVLGDIVDAVHLHRHVISSCCNTSSCSFLCISCCIAVLIMRVVAGLGHTDAMLDVPCIVIDDPVCFLRRDYILWCSYDRSCESDHVVLAVVYFSYVMIAMIIA